MSGAITSGRSPLAAARAFYCDALGGRQMPRAKRGDDTTLSFLVGDDLVTTGPAAMGGRITLVVDDAIEVAARCWDAGFTVNVRDAADSTTISVIDPFDLELGLATSDERLTPPVSTTPDRRDSLPSARAE